MKGRPFFFLLAALLLWSATLSRTWAAGSLTQQVDPPEVNVGDEVTVTIKVQNTGAEDFELPHVDGLQPTGRNTMSGITIDNGSFSSSVTAVFTLVPTRAGDFTIPAFDVQTHDGTLHVEAMKVHVLASGITPANPAPAAPAASPGPGTTGPVVMPPNGTTPAANPPASDTNSSAPLDGDGQPVKVFLLITPKTTDAFVGESVPIRIEFFIRTDVDAPQDSLPTIKGSDFLMNNLSPRPQQDEQIRGGESYHRYAWMTAISAPRSGDFPLQMEHDVYWARNENNGGDPFANLFGQNRNLQHAEIGSNALTMHVHTLPEEGCPPDFSGAIGQFKVTAAAAPDSVAVGEPVTIHFAVSGEGNFGYVKAPALAKDPAWKNYVPAAKTEYEDESHTQAIKTFEQAVIPQRNGNLPLPPANFSYFDPQTKQYVTIPVPLPSIQVTGEMPTAAAAPPTPNDQSTAAAPILFAGNRLDAGPLFADLNPLYKQTWFWAAQGGLTALALVTAFLFFIRSRRVEDRSEATRAHYELEMQNEQAAMTQAVQDQDVQAFFAAARHALQLHCALRWHLVPEAITLEEIRRHDPNLGDSVEPLFQKADEVSYSGQAAREDDLAQWERRVQEEWLQMEPS